MKQDLNILVDWFRANKLSLNLGKTNFILFRPKSKKNDISVSLTYDNIDIKQEKVTKFLGIYLDECLQWDSQIKHVCSKMSKNLYLLRTLKNVLPSWSLKSLYFAYIHSHMVYGICCWGPMASKMSIKRIKTLQNKALRIITKANYNASTKPLAKKLDILLFDELVDLELSKISYRYTNRSLPKPVRELFQDNSFTHRYNTRARNHPRIEKHKSASFYKNTNLLSLIKASYGKHLLSGQTFHTV